MAERERTILEWTFAALTAIGSALGIRDYVRKAVEKSVGPLVAPLMDDHRAELVDEMRRLAEEPRKRLEARLIKPQTPYTQARIVQLLTKLQKDPQTGRCETLTWLANMPEDEFYTYMNILYHDTIVEWMKRVGKTDGPISPEYQAEFRRIAWNIFAGIGSFARGTHESSLRITDRIATGLEDWARRRTS